MKPLAPFTCPHCRGARVIEWHVDADRTDGHPCEDCGGTGHIPLDDDEKAAIALPADLIRQHDNGYSVQRELAERAIEAGQEAYWTSERYHHQAAIALVGTANRDGLKAALSVWAVEWLPGRTEAALLRTIIPLNSSAREEHAELLHRAVTKEVGNAVL